MNDYKAFKLPTIAGGHMPRRVIYFDTETKQKRVDNIERHRMKMAWTCLSKYTSQGVLERDVWTFFETSIDLCEYFEKTAVDKRPMFLMGHNVFFDLQSSDFFHYFTKWGWILDFYYDSGLTYILALRKGRKTIKCLSTTNWFDGSLKVLGEMIGLPKLDVDFEESTLEELKTYCKRDVEIIKAAMEQYYQLIIDNDLGRFSMTKASQAFNAYRHRFMINPIYIHNEDEIKDFERQAYMGGRVECFKIGKIKGGPFLSLDVNSMYPFIMKNYDMPYELVNYHEDLDLPYVTDILKSFCVVAEVDVKTDLPIYAYKYNDKLTFPIGSFRCFLCTEGLKEALKRGQILKIHRASIYRKARLFEKYVDNLYDLRRYYKESKQDVMVKLCKYLLNSLYGKFGQQIKKTKEEVDITFDGYWRMEGVDLVKQCAVIEYKMLNKYVIEDGLREGPKSFPAISAHITEAGRMLLWDIMERSNWSKVLYCDTDSIKIRKKDLKGVNYPLDDKTLGALKIEEETKKLTLIAPKAYTTENETKMKGIPKVAKYIGNNDFSYQSFLRQKIHMRKEITRYYMVRDTIKHLNEIYDKGLVDTKGNVSPYSFSLPR